MIITIQFLGGKSGLVTDVSEECTVGDMKEKIAALPNGPPATDQRLLFGGHLLTDDATTLADLDIFGETCLLCVPKQLTKQPKQAAPSATATSTATATATESSPATSPSPTSGGAGKKRSTVWPEQSTREVFVETADLSPADAVEHKESASDAEAEAEADAEAEPQRQSPRQKEKEEMIPLILKTLRGTTTLLEVPAKATFGHIKHQYIQPLERIPAVQMRLIYMGQLTQDHLSPFDYNICDESFIHLVRRPNDSIKGEVITQHNLRANCPWCHKAGVQLKLRPQCGSCGKEGAMYKDLVVEIGRSRWKDLEGLKGICYGCSSRGKEVDLHMGFLCTGRPGDKTPSCPGRNPHTRKMIHTYKGGDLVESLNEIFGYAHARGFEV